MSYEKVGDVQMAQGNLPTGAALLGLFSVQLCP